MHGIVNGTSNYILSKMTDEGQEFGRVLAEAQAKGYAEADPTYDVEGIDSAHKLQILATLAFRTSVKLKDIYVEGISRITPQDIALAREMGFRIKLLAIAKAADGKLELRVHPTMIPENSPMSAVSGVFNAIFLNGDVVNDLMFYGRGAGQMPTASSVWADIVEIARRLAAGQAAVPQDLPVLGRKPLILKPIEEVTVGVLPVCLRAGPAGGARAGRRDPRKTRNQHRQRDTEDPPACEGSSCGDDDARGKGRLHAEGAAGNQRVARHRRSNPHDSRGSILTDSRFDSIPDS